MTTAHESSAQVYGPHWDIDKIQVFTYDSQRTMRVIVGQSVEPFDMQNGAFDLHPDLACMELSDILSEKHGLQRCSIPSVKDVAYELILEFPWCANIRDAADTICRYFTSVSCKAAQSDGSERSVVYHFHIPTTQQG